MAKYYVESGTVQAIVDCMDVEGAALWAVNLVMGEMDSMDFFDEEDALHAASEKDCHQLDASIRVSEQGFGRQDAEVVSTENALQEWFELSRALAVLSAKLDW